HRLTGEFRLRTIGEQLLARRGIETVGADQEVVPAFAAVGEADVDAVAVVRNALGSYAEPDLGPKRLRAIGEHALQRWPRNPELRRKVLPRKAWGGDDGDTGAVRCEHLDRIKRECRSKVVLENAQLSDG